MGQALPEFAERGEECLHAAGVGECADEDAHVAGECDPPVDERRDDVVQADEEALHAAAVGDDVEQAFAECGHVRAEAGEVHAEFGEVALPDRDERLGGLRGLAKPVLDARDHVGCGVADLAELRAEVVDRAGDVLHADGLDDLLDGFGHTVADVLERRADALGGVPGLLGEARVLGEALFVEAHDGLVEVVETVGSVLHGLVQVVGVVAGSHHGLGDLIELAGHGGLYGSPRLHVHLAGGEHLRVLG